MKRALALSIIDQAMISGFNLVLNLALIAFATPEQFGIFVLVQAIGFFAISAQNALIITPLNYLLPGQPEPVVQRELSMLTSANAILILLGLVLALALAMMINADLPLYLAILAFFGVTLAREYVRNVLVITERIAQTLILDAAAIAATFLLLLGFWQILPPAAAALFALALGNLIVLVAGRIRLHWQPARLTAHFGDYRRVWEKTRWALQGALQNEVEARSYVILLERWRDAAALGTIQAGRTVLSPLLLIAPSWRRIARPKIVRHLQNGEHDAVRATLWSGALVIAAASLAYGLVIYLAWPLFEAHVFKGRYGDMHNIVLGWWIYALVVGLAGIAATQLEAQRRFRALAMVGLVIAGLVIIVLAPLVWLGASLMTIVLALAALHVLELIAYLVLIARPGEAFVEAAP